MRWRNTGKGYGWVAIALHWLVALVVFGLFGLGLWMVELSYYDPWYRQAPAIHKALGVLLFLAVVGRLAWRGLNPLPALPGGRLERLAARLVHGAMYVLLLAVMAAGYLISTADGSAIDVFGLFSVPATVTDLPDQEDIAGDVHRWLAWTLIALVGLHTIAAFKHQFIDRDGTLMRMLRPGQSAHDHDQGA